MRALNRATWLALVCFSAGLLLFPPASSAHRSGCHRWHRCPSDRETYVCGDLGYCSQCPDNEYCSKGKPRVKVQEEKRQEDKEAGKKRKSGPQVKPKREGE